MSRGKVTRRLRTLLARIPTKKIGGFLRDIVMLGGLALAGGGVWMIHRPSALIYAGLVIAGLAFLTDTPDEPNE